MIRRFISTLMIAAAAVFVCSCESSDGDSNSDQYALEGDKYIGSMTVSIPDYDDIIQPDITYYIDFDGEYADVMMPDVSFMSGLMPNLDMALLDIPFANSDPDVYSSPTAQMVGIYDHLPLINDVIKSISEVTVVDFGEDRVNVSFDCAISTSHLGDIVATVSFMGTKDGVILPDEDEDEDLNVDDGFYITISTGATSQIEDVTVSYYEGDNTLIVDGFKYNNAIPMGSTLVMKDLASSGADGLYSVTGDGFSVDYSVMGQANSSNISDLRCEIDGDTAEMEFWILYNEFNYPCTYGGTIEVYEGSYVAE